MLAQWLNYSLATAATLGRIPGVRIILWQGSSHRSTAGDFPRDLRFFSTTCDHCRAR